LISRALYYLTAEIEKKYESLSSVDIKACIVFIIFKLNKKKETHQMNEILNIFKDGVRQEIPEDLDRFKPISFTERGRLIFKVSIIKRLLNIILGWDTQRSNYDREHPSAHEIVGLKITDGFRFAPKENDRLRERIELMTQFNLSSIYWHGWNSRPQYNEDLKSQSKNLNTLLTKYKTIRSKNNYNTCLDITISTFVMNCMHECSGDAELWDKLADLINNNSNRDWWNQRSVTCFLIGRNRGGLSDIRDFPTSENNTSDRENPRNFSIITNPMSLACDFIVLIRYLLKQIKLCPLTNDEFQFPALEDYIEGEFQSFEDSKDKISNINITDALILKEPNSLRSITKIHFKELDAYLWHPNGKELTPVIRSFKDIHNNHYGMYFYAVKTLRFCTNREDGELKIIDVKNYAHSDLNNHSVFYCTSALNDQVGRDSEKLFNEERDYIPAMNTCFNSYGSNITSGMQQRSYLPLFTHVKSWLINYICTKTSPYKHPRDVFYGLPINIPKWYENLHDASSSACMANLYRHSIEIQQRDQEINTNAIEPGHEIRPSMQHKLNHVSDVDLTALLDNKCSDCQLISTCYLNKYAHEALPSYYDDKKACALPGIAPEKFDMPGVCRPTVSAVESILAEGRVTDEGIEPVFEIIEDVPLEVPLDPNIITTENTRDSERTPLIEEVVDYTIEEAERRRDIMQEMSSWAITR